MFSCLEAWIYFPDVCRLVRGGAIVRRQHSQGCRPPVLGCVQKTSHVVPLLRHLTGEGGRAAEEGKRLLAVCGQAGLGSARGSAVMGTACRPVSFQHGRLVTAITPRRPGACSLVRMVSQWACQGAWSCFTSWEVVTPTGGYSWGGEKGSEGCSALVLVLLATSVLRVHS